MKKLIAGLALMLISSVTFAETFECTGYFNGAPVGPAIKVEASKTAVAETKAHDRMRKDGIKLDYVKCK
ncbi:hypothetical protein AU255_06970 [Methyloprofundus sedimenti]|uniref:Uncharacterized protein n=1 Tax=Methyloprofundus sedimenti TaxID=1420851 RepID=A0A1V8M887_9GAMM|nr:hypothetical protein [Methyloprofundus sedimenti]OQK17603.1 hypothetical protein AU255_06970 [Methyloprofundus sedimenti]